VSPKQTGGDIDELGSSVEVEGADIDEDPDEDDLLGGLKIDTTAELEIPDRLVDQVIGQEHARDVIIKAAKQRRHVMMIGSPGTGKSMLAKAMSELLPKEELQDVLGTTTRTTVTNRRSGRCPPARATRSSTRTAKRRASATRCGRC